MILTCPACQTQYILPEDALLGKNGEAKARTVKCAACAFSWKQSPISVTDINLESVAQDTYASDDDTIGSYDNAADMAQQLRWQQALQADIAATMAPPLSFGGFVGRTAGWLALLLLFTSISLIYLRDDLAQVWPPSALFYETIGFPAPLAGAGLSFEDDAKAELVAESIPPRLHVTGHFRNTAPHATSLPVLQARSFNSQGAWLKDWSIPLNNIQNIAGNGRMGFDYTLPQVPLDAQSLTFRFVDE